MYYVIAHVRILALIAWQTRKCMTAAENVIVRLSNARLELSDDCSIYF